MLISLEIVINTFWKEIRMRLLVTGGAGFIGSNLVNGLIDKGFEVVVFDDLSTGDERSINPRSEFVRGDVRDYQMLQEVTRNVDCIFHLAAFVSVPESIKHPSLCYDVNVNGTLNLIKAAGSNGVKKIIFSSSCSVYKDAQEKAISEEDSVNPMTPYALSKLEGEKLLGTYSREFGFSYVILRYFNVFGEGQNPESPYSSVIPKFIARALNNQDIFINGDGRQTRDFIYVKDVIDANIGVMNSNFDSEVFNVGTGEVMSINRLAAHVIDICGSSSKIVYKPHIQGQIQYSLCDMSKIARLLDWKPQYGFEDALAKTIEWYKESQYINSPVYLFGDTGKASAYKFADQ